MGSSMELRINLGALKRHDPYIENITDSSTHVAVYSFSPQLNEWEKTDVEGTLFVYKRVAPPFWGFTILNRLSMENLTEPLTSELEFQTQNPFLLYRNAKLLIYGIWFYDQEDCKRIGALLEQLCRDSTRPVVDSASVKRVNLFIGGENIAQNKDPLPRPGSPTSNSVNSISPGSSVGAAIRPLSNGEADSESEDKEVTLTNKGSVDILDLLSKAQDKYEKGKRNTPDPVIDGVYNGTVLSPTEAEVPLVKPVPVKPSHPQKLDVATLFKQHPPKPPDAGLVVPANIPPVAVATSSSLLAATTMSVGFAAMPAPTPSVAIPQQKRLPRPIGRSYSMTEMAMRQQLDPYANGNIMSVEEIEAGIGSRNPMTATRQQQVNSTLDRMIDRINSGVLVNDGNSGGPSQPPSLPGIQETSHATVVNPSVGNSGTMVVNGNKAIYGDNNVFPSETNAHPYTALSHSSQPTFVKPLASLRQRSVSSSSIQQTRHAQMPTTIASAVSGNVHFTQNFPLVNLNAVSHPKSASSSNSLPMAQLGSQKGSTQHLLLHGNQPTSSNNASYCVPNQSPSISSVTVSVASGAISGQTPKVPVNAASIHSGAKSSPVLPTALISPEDFERSASTPQKKLELKQRLLQDVQQPPQNNGSSASAAIIPLTKEQLQQTLVSLLQKDSAFLTLIHEAYMTNFKQT